MPVIWMFQDWLPVLNILREHSRELELLTDFDFEREFHKNKFVFDYLFNFFIYLKKEIELRALQRFI